MRLWLKGRGIALHGEYALASDITILGTVDHIVGTRWRILVYIFLVSVSPQGRVANSERWRGFHIRDRTKQSARSIVLVLLARRQIMRDIRGCK